ncbi:MAG: subtype A tannase [Tractidigestivibacter sp.]|uniref:subtype A tannase n=1 Tax=Tractidigestivibacter sp. TaxID=2847320 RepID=UPI003D8ABEA8
MTRRAFMGTAGVAALALAACSSGEETSSASDSTATATEAISVASSSNAPEPTGALAIDMAAWNHDDGNDVWWQVGIAYCESPATTDYETMGLYVPGAYLTGTDNGDGTYTCELAQDGAAGDYTATTAPIVIPVNTAGYSAQEAPTSYSYDSLSAYLEAGLIYAYPGCRGRANGYDSSGTLVYSGGAPWGATDLKAAVRYLRYNAALLPGDMSQIYTFGHSGGGAQSAIMGATGDSDQFEPYLESIGAADSYSDGSALSDAVAGSMCWCPITALDVADCAYEWNMGQFSTSGTRADGTWTKLLSDDLAARFPELIDKLGLVDENGNELALESSDDGIYLAGSYYDYIVSVIQTSLNNFLEDTEFPYTPSTSTMADGGFGGGLTGDSTSSAPSGAPTDSSSAPTDSGSLPSDAGSAPSGTAPTDSTSASSSSDSTTYETAADYIDSLNANGEWIAYDESSNTATVSSLSGFVSACKSASKDVGAFDATDRSQAENQLFGNDDSDYLHFDQELSDLLSANADSYAECDDWDSTLPDAYAGDLELTDALGETVTSRVSAYNPMSYLCSCYKLAGTSTIAPHWRIRTGIEQGDTALTTEVNLALALQANDAVSDVDFATVWGLGHTTAERTGDADDNFISWVKQCVQG